MSVKEWWVQLRREGLRHDLLSEFDLWKYNFPLRLLLTPPDAILWIHSRIYGDTHWHIVGKLKNSFFERFHTYEESQNIYLGLRDEAVRKGNCLWEDFVPCPQIEVPAYGFPVLFKTNAPLVPQIETQFQAKYFNSTQLSNMGISEAEILTPMGNPKEYTRQWWWEKRHLKRLDMDEVIPIHTDVSNDRERTQVHSGL
jgi:hypothetical protein